uniref:Uncharacterized protein n=1 Tax=Rhizophagus irregularis (strain DAOM 181602 / DAOM 197198 / MUCL 43194) TaxID=747089 RepID=U9TYK7_RHIID
MQLKYSLDLLAAKSVVDDASFDFGDPDKDSSHFYSQYIQKNRHSVPLNSHFIKMQYKAKVCL